MADTPLAQYPQSFVPPQMQDVYERNSPYVVEGAPAQFNTKLMPLQEMMFRDWLQSNKVPFDPEAKVADYDMRGFYQGLINGHPRAQAAINPNDQKMHYPDYWKTPYHQTFSNDSQWAVPNAPSWNDKDQLVTQDGRIIHDERAGARENPADRLGANGVLRGLNYILQGPNGAAQRR